MGSYIQMHEILNGRRPPTCLAAPCVQNKREEGGGKVVRALLSQLQEHREDDWVEWIIYGEGWAGLGGGD